MIYGRLFKKGTLQTTANGSLALMNERRVAYPVNRADSAVWNQCTGVTLDQLQNTISSKLGWQTPPEVLSHIERFVNWCIWAKLIEVNDFTPDQFAELTWQDSLNEEASRKLASMAMEEIAR
jgi:hypothetical protein